MRRASRCTFSTALRSSSRCRSPQTLVRDRQPRGQSVRAGICRAVHGWARESARSRHRDAPGAEARDPHRHVARSAAGAPRRLRLLQRRRLRPPTFPIAARTASGTARGSRASACSRTSATKRNKRGSRRDSRRPIADFVGDPGRCETHRAHAVGDRFAQHAHRGSAAAAHATIVTTAEEHGSALMPTFARRALGDRVVVVPHADDASFLGW